MKWNRQLIASLLALCLLGVAFPMRTFSAALDVTYGEAKYSYIAIEQYSRRVAFHNGAVVAADSGNRYGLLRPDETEALPFQYDDLSLIDEGLYAASSGGQYGIIRQDGNVVVPFQYNHLARLVTGFYLAESSQGAMVIDASGRAYYGPSQDYEYFRVYDDRISIVEHSDAEGWKYLYYTKNMQPMAETLSSEGSEEDGSANLSAADLSAYSRTSNNGNNSYRVWTDDTHSGVIDKDGNWILPLGEYQEVGRTSPGGYVTAATYEGATYNRTLSNVVSVLYQRGQQVFTVTDKLLSSNSSNELLRFTTTGEFFGLMDHAQTVLLEESYSTINVDYPDSNKSFTAYTRDAAGSYQYILLDENGRSVFGRSYNSINSLSSGLYVVREGELYGVLDKNGQQIIPIAYKDISDEDQFLELNDGEKYTLTDKSGTPIISGAPGPFNVYESWSYRGWTIGSIEHFAGEAQQYDGYGGKIYTVCSESDYTQHTGTVTYYLDYSTYTIIGEIPHLASNINDDGVFAWWDETKSAYGFGWYQQNQPSDNIVASGTCGAAGNEENVRWTLYTDGRLVISGTGAMADYSSSRSASSTPSAPWFDQRESIRSAVIEHGVTSVGSYAFEYCASLTSVTIPDSVISIGSSVFSGCSSLTSMAIPENVTSIGHFAFYGCRELTGINVSSGNTLYSSMDGVLFDAAKTRLEWYPAGKNSVNYTIPESVTSIKTGAFINCRSLKSVSILGNVTSIEGNAFQSCTSLTSVTIPNSVTSIKVFAFDDCTALTDVYYGGTQSQWEALKGNVDQYNDPLLNATIHYGETPSGGLAAPTNLHWITERGTRTKADGTTIQVYPGSFSFDDTLNIGEVQYEIDISSPGGSFDEQQSGISYPSTYRGTFYEERGFSTENLQTGLYRFRVTVKDPQDSSPSNDSSISALSDVWSYTRPSAQLTAPAGLQMTESKVTWNAVPNAEDYEWEICYSGTAADGNFNGYYVYDTRPSSGNPETEGNASNFISRNGAGYYHLRVRTLSNDITKVLCSEWSEEVVVYSDGTTSQPVSQTYNIVLYSNYGSGVSNAHTQPVRAGESFTLPGNTYTRDGYTLTGWNTAADGSGTSYEVGASVTPTGNLALYAQWDAIPEGYGILDRLYDMYKYEDQSFRIDGPLSEFAGLTLDGNSLTADSDFTVSEVRTTSQQVSYPTTGGGTSTAGGSSSSNEPEAELSSYIGTVTDNVIPTTDGQHTVTGEFRTTQNTTNSTTRINIPASTFQTAGEGTHTIAATFAASDATGSSVQRTTTQSYTVDLSGQTALSISALRDAVQYVPYSATVETFPHYADLRFKVIDGSLPSDGDWSLDPVTGEINGVPQEAGAVYTFTVGVSHGDGETLAQTVVRIQVKDNTSTNVISETDPGFRVLNPIPNMVEVTADQVFRSEGEFSEFKDFYLNGVKQARDVDYKAEEGSTRITVFKNALARLGKGEHTAAATFNVRNREGVTEQKVSSQNFTVGVQSAPVRSSGGGGGGGSRNPSYAINLKQVTGGTVKASTTSARSGAKVTLTLTPKTGYIVKDVKVTGTNVAGDVAVTKNGNQYTFTMPGKQVTVTPTFGPAPRRVSATEAEHGKLSVRPTSAVPGAKVTITAIPDNGYVAAAFSAWDEKGQYLTVKDNGDGTATFTMPESPVQVGGRFELDPGLPVTDIKPTDWFYEDARWAYRRGIMTGVTGTTWVPEDRMSTATAVVTLARLAGADLTAYQTENWTVSEENDGSYNWIPNEWYAAEARWAARNRILTEDIFTGREVLPRAKLAIMLRRFLAQQGVTPELTEDPTKQPVFSDTEAIKSFGTEAEEAFRILHEADVFRGDSTKAMLPGAATKRSHLAATLHRLSEYIIGYWETKAATETTGTAETAGT